MEIILDSKENKSLAQLCSYLNKPIRIIANKNGNGLLELILGCIGISSLTEEYEDFFNPYSYYRGYQNNNENFNPELGLLKILNHIKENKELLNSFLNEIFRRLQGITIEDDTLEKIENVLKLLGYELIINYDENICKYQIIYLSGGEIERQLDMSMMRNNLKNSFPEILIHYNEALETYSNGNFKSCIDNCRTAFEKFFKQLDTEQKDYLKGILKVTNEHIVENGQELTSKKKIFNYWLVHNKGANRYRLLATVYSVMAGLGPHGEDTAVQEDALMILRITEDIFLWYLQKNI